MKESYIGKPETFLEGRRECKCYRTSGNEARTISGRMPDDAKANLDINDLATDDSDSNTGTSVGSGTIHLQEEGMYYASRSNTASMKEADQMIHLVANRRRSRWQ
jgi:hypothetical protein